jgi:hypothetical protein
MPAASAGSLLRPDLERIECRGAQFDVRWTIPMLTHQFNKEISHE